MALASRMTSTSDTDKNSNLKPTVSPTDILQPQVAKPIPLPQSVLKCEEELLPIKLTEVKQVARGLEVDEVEPSAFQ